MHTTEKILQLTESYWLNLHDEKKVEQRLIQQGLNEGQLNIARTFLRKKKCAAKRATGIFWLIAGVLMLGVGFISTVFLFHSGDSFQLVLYGLTLIGIVAVGIGCYFIFSE